MKEIKPREIGDSVDKQSSEIKTTRGGYRPGAGRPKGTPNRVTASLREAIVKAFEDLGGVEWVKTLATEDTRAFVMLLVKVIPPAPKDIEEVVGLAERLAEARARVKREGDDEEAELRGLSDEELINRMEEMVKDFRGGGTCASNRLTKGFRKALNQPVTLEELVAMSWESKDTEARVIADVPSPEPEQPMPLQRPEPAVVPILPPPPAIRSFPRQQADEQLPGQAVNSHRRAQDEDPSSSTGMSIHDEDPFS